MKKLLAVLLIIAISFIISGAQKADMYTVEEHVQRITERINSKKDILAQDNKIEIENYSVYPLYDENEESTMFLVEIEPFGFTFIELRDEENYLKPMSCSVEKSPMYKISDFYGIDTWSPHIKDPTNPQHDPHSDKIWILDENGERIYHNRSPYYVTGNIDERKYLIETEGGEYICAIKKDGKYINLISGEEFTVENVSQYELSKTQATIYICILYLEEYNL